MSKWIIFSDFDGTITTTDVGNTMFLRFSGGKTKDVVKKWRLGEITSKRCLEEECALSNAGWNEIYEYLNTKKIDESFIKFYNAILNSGLNLYILSDGFGFYIRYILHRYHLYDIPFFSNDMTITEGRLIPIFPYYGCGCGECGNCKLYHIKRLKKNNKAVYIGDGLSDKHVIEEADLLFAKDMLAKYCEERDREYIPYKSFSDIEEKLRTLNIIR